MGTSTRPLPNDKTSIYFTRQIFSTFFVNALNAVMTVTLTLARKVLRFNIQ